MAPEDNFRLILRDQLSRILNMESPTTPSRFSWPVLVTILVAAVVTGAILSTWSYMETKKQRVFETTIFSLEETIRKQEHKLEKQEEVNRRLVENLSGTQKTTLELESELDGMRTRLSEAREELTVAEERLAATEAELTALKDMGWESQYRLAVRENETLSEKIAAMELQQSLAREETEEMEQINNELTEKNEALSDEFTLLELERDDLARSYDQLRDKYIDESDRRKKLVEDISREEKLSDDRARRISELEDTVSKNERIISRLRSDIESYETMIAELQQEFAAPLQEQAGNKKPVEVIVGGSTKRDREPGSEYRITRLQSLNQAMNGRDSVERKQILISVIPTIPNGISGEELAGLITGMNSADILSVIQSTRQHISRPLDNESLSILFSSMNREDADSASVILASDS